ncbi:hypothetical protein ANASTE_01576 [Anaerofustis stercorihominis DSM 17244]|uniref:Uncharacterized protein n=1 Tax=Anaerofustis stercorihominis DSM 17244 TaxID=445971 RepID=B1CC76_9FIRM|nr:hypothetical protein [Anaerofustis stercorihominis]EDS71873.1 hypothetical protein ANASTE_01576 [Anaerofustis stercorihominis DSM 17244]
MKHISPKNDEFITVRTEVFNDMANENADLKSNLFLINKNIEEKDRIIKEQKQHIKTLEKKLLAYMRG